MAGRALIPIHLSPRHQIPFIGLDRRRLHHLAIDPRMKRDPYNLPLQRKRRIRNRNRWMPKLKPHYRRNRHKQQSQHNSQ